MSTVIIAGAALLLLAFLAYRSGKSATKEKQSDELVSRVERSKKNRELARSKSAIAKLRAIAKDRNK